MWRSYRYNYVELWILNDILKLIFYLLSIFRNLTVVDFTICLVYLHIVRYFRKTVTGGKYPQIFIFNYSCACGNFSFYFLSAVEAWLHHRWLKKKTWSIRSFERSFKSLFNYYQFYFFLFLNTFSCWIQNSAWLYIR